jgi:type I restriction enzyme S subunit
LQPSFSHTGVSKSNSISSNWGSLPMGHLAADQVLGKMLDRVKNTGTSRPYLGNINVRWGFFDLANLKEMRIEDSELERYGLLPGDLVVCEGGEPGRCSVWKSTGGLAIIQKALHRVRFTRSYNPRFAYYFMVFAAATHTLDRSFTGTTIKHLTGEGLAKIAFPICPRSEQDKIVSALDEQISGIEILESDITTNLQKAEALRQSILKKAFSGELVPQEPADEPASVLLARIRAERANAQTSTAGQQRGRKPTGRKSKAGL